MDNQKQFASDMREIGFPEEARDALENARVHLFALPAIRPLWETAEERLFRSGTGDF